MVKKVPGAYVITHDDTGVFYVGSTDDLKNRGYQHNGELRSNTHHAKKLQEAYNQSTHISTESIPTLDRETAYDAEQKLLDRHWGNPLLANTSPTAKSNKGVKLSADAKANISAGKIGVFSESQRQHVVALNKSRTGVPPADSTKALMSEQRKGVPKSEEHAKAIGNALRGKPKTAEHVAKVQAARAGFKHDEETKARIAAKLRATLAAKKALLKN